MLALKIPDFFFCFPFLHMHSYLQLSKLLLLHTIAAFVSNIMSSQIWGWEGETESLLSGYQRQGYIDGVQR